MNVLLVWDRIGDYHIARFHALSSIIAPHQCFIADLGPADKLYGWQNALANDNRYTCLSNKSVDEADLHTRFINFKKLVKKHQIKAVGISGYGRSEYRYMMMYCQLHGIKVVMFAESWYAGNAITDILKGMLIRLLANTCFVSGIKAHKHFTQRLHIPKNRVAIGYSVVDNAHFANTDVNCNNEKILLCIARFSKEKALDVLIKAFQASMMAGSWQLMIVGGGPERAYLESLITPSSHITLQNWTSYQQLPQVYKKASVFILPSTFEPWGLVVNEAMAASLPIAVSDACGCQPDLVDEENGWIFKAGDADALTMVLNQIFHTPEHELSHKGKHSYRRIQKFSPQQWATTFKNLCQC